MLEATVVLSKCSKTKKVYGIRMEHKKDRVWHCTWAFPVSQAIAKEEGYGTTKISGHVQLDPEYPGCPYCNATGWVSCGACGKLTCWNGRTRHFTCAWCGNTGELSSGGGSSRFDLTGGEF